MHWIQRHILKELAFSDGRRYSELKPDTVEGNLFQYHGRDLERQGLITRTDGVYSLTTKGSRYVADLNTIRPSAHKTPPRPVVMVAATNEAGEQLLFRWRRHPYRGRVGLPFGRVFSGQGLSAMTAEQLRDKTGYTADLGYLGQISLPLADNHLLISVFTAANLVKAAEPDGKTGEAFWADPKTINEVDWIPGMRQIVDWVNDPDRPGLLELGLSE